MRESKSSYQRADIVILTKCPEKIDKTKSKSLKDQLNIKPHQTLFYTTISYNSRLKGDCQQDISSLKKQKIFLVTGIADSSKFVNFLKKNENTVPQANATINTESPAWGVDRLSILALKVFHMNEEAIRENASEEHRNACQTKLTILLEQRTDLSTAIDQLIKDIEAGVKYMKVYKQMKMYNDDELNPVLREGK